ILLDEIEKAHPDVFNILLQVLDDGRLTDNKGRTVSFRNTIVIMTSNIGSPIIQENMAHVTDANREEVYEKTREQVFELMKQTIRPEFLNRIDEIIMFTPLNRNQIREIVRIQIALVQKQIANQLTLQLTDKAIDWIADKGYDPQFGARPVKRLIQREILNELSKEILAGTIAPDKPLVIDADEQGLKFRND
ncbi:MAG: AAA family ATPase, partial [Bacteroidales bacterium]|nr:AAA family ATPase [Bacteroidales bacterium]